MKGPWSPEESGDHLQKVWVWTRIAEMWWLVVVSSEVAFHISDVLGTVWGHKCLTLLSAFAFLRAPRNPMIFILKLGEKMVVLDKESERVGVFLRSS